MGTTSMHWVWWWLTACLAVFALALLVAPMAAGEEPGVATQRIGGSDRIDTAARIAEGTFTPARTASAIVVQADGFADALAAAPLAGLHEAPLLLTHHDELPARTAAVLDALEVGVVVIVGGEAAVSREVEERLAERHTVDRIAGDDRFGTAAAVARRIARVVGVPEAEGHATVLLASGETFADALAASPLAYAGGHPLLLVTSDALPEATAAVLADLDVDRAIAVGGGEAIGDPVLEEIKAAGVSTARIAGADRGATAAAFADALVARFGFAADRVLLARGDAYPDALAGAARAGRLLEPVLLTSDPGALGDAAAGWLEARCEHMTRLTALGGPAALSEGTLAAAARVAGVCVEPEPEPEPARTLTYRTGTRGSPLADLAIFRQRVSEALNDPRGWALDGEIAFAEVDGGEHFRVWLASPEAVAAAHPVCHRSWSCRVGNDVYINDERWRESTATYRNAGRSLTEYRWYVVNHEVGHWLGHGHYSCPGQGRPAPVMQQQSIRLDGCRTNVWALEFERDMVRDRWLN